MKNKNIYLDNHSSTQIDGRVYNKMKPFLTKIFDSTENGYTKLKIKIFEINYKNFYELND